MHLHQCFNFHIPLPHSTHTVFAFDSECFFSWSLQMYKQNKGTPEKPKAVSYFNQFPSNFLKPYGKADSAPDDDTISRRTNPISCEWLFRPRVAMSEFAETITENLQLLQDDNLALVNTSKFASISDSGAPMLDALSRLNTKTKLLSSKRDINTVMTYLCDN